MANSTIQLAPDGSGKKVDTSALTVGANAVERQRVVLGDDTAAAGLAVVTAANGLQVDLTRIKPIASSTGYVDAVDQAVTVTIADGVTMVVASTKTLPFTATHVYEVTYDGTNWVPAYGTVYNSANADGFISNTTGSTNKVSHAYINVAGATSFRIRCTARSAGNPEAKVTQLALPLAPQATVRAQGMSRDNQSGSGWFHSIGGLDYAANVMRQVNIDGANGNYSMRVSGAGASGSAMSGDPIRVGGTDGTNTRNILTDSTGKLMLAAATSAVALADNYANPSAGHIASPAFLFNGSTWDRQRNVHNVASGDTGTRNGTFNGTTQTNYNASGATIVLAVSAASGTTPTLNVKIQGSDDGANFYDIPGASMGTATITAAGTYVMQIHPALTPAKDATSPLISALLPRIWRLVFVMGGTSPSFTFTRINIVYHP